MVKIFELEFIQRETAGKGDSKMAQWLNVLVAKPPEFDPQGPRGEKKKCQTSPN